MPAPTKFSYTIQDESGDLSTALLYVAYDALSETVASILGAAADFGGVIDAVTGGKIKEFNVTINALPDPSWKSAAIADSDVQKILLENFNLNDTTYPEPIEIPALNPSLVDANGHPILTGGGAIALMNAKIASGSGAVYPCNEFLIDITSLRDAAVSFRKSKNSRQKSKVKA